MITCILRQQSNTQPCRNFCTESNGYVTEFRRTMETAVFNFRGLVKTHQNFWELILLSSVEDVYYFESWLFYFYFTYFDIVIETTRTSKQNSSNIRPYCIQEDFWFHTSIAINNISFHDDLIISDYIALLLPIVI